MDKFTCRRTSVFNIYPGIDGYKIMCKFQMYYLWIMFDYDYVIKIDEDIS